MDTHRTGIRARRLRSLIAAFFVVLVAAVSADAVAGSTCPAQQSALESCQNAIAGRSGASVYHQCDPISSGGRSGYQDNTYNTATGALITEGGGYYYTPCAVDPDPPPPDLCASSSSFSGWMDFTGNVSVSCKEGCAYAFGDGESGAKNDDSGEQRFFGTFQPLGRSCTSAESASSGTPAVGDPPPDPPKDPGPGTGDGNTPGTGTGDGGTGSGTGTGTGTGGGTGTGTGTGTGDGSGTGSGGNGTGTGGNGTGTGGSGTGSGTGGSGGGTGTGGTGTGGTGTGSGSGTGTGNGSGTGTGTGSGSGSGDGSGTGSGNGSGTCSGSSCNPSSGSTAATPPKDTGSYSGDACSAPPQCTGDAVMCGVAMESHKNRCAIEKAFVGTSATPDGKGVDHTQSELIGPDVDVTDGTTLDQSGFGLDSSCPLKPFTYEFGDTSASMDWSALCDSVVGLRAFIMIMASVACWRIMRGESKSTGGIL